MITKENTSITIGKEVLKEGKKLAKEQKRSFSSMVEILVEKAIKERSRK